MLPTLSGCEEIARRKVGVTLSEKGGNCRGARLCARISRVTWSPARAAGAQPCAPTVGPTLLCLGRLPCFDGHKVPPRRAGVDLARAGDLLVWVLDHFLPLRQPAGNARDGKEHREHVHRELHGLIDQAGVEVDVRVELALDEVLVLEGDALELQGDVE